MKKEAQSNKNKNNKLSENTKGKNKHLIKKVNKEVDEQDYEISQPSQTESDVYFSDQQNQSQQNQSQFSKIQQRQLITEQQKYQRQSEDFFSQINQDHDYQDQQNFTEEKSSVNQNQNQNQNYNKNNKNINKNININSIVQEIKEKDEQNELLQPIFEQIQKIKEQHLRLRPQLNQVQKVHNKEQKIRQQQAQIKLQPSSSLPPPILPCPATLSSTPTPSPKPQLMDYLQKILNGTISQSQLQKKRQQQIKRTKIQQHIKQIYKRKIQQKIKRQNQQLQKLQKQSQYSTKSSVGLKLLQSTHHDTMDMFKDNFSIKNQQNGQNNQTLSQFAKKSVSRKRMTKDMLRMIMKDLQILLQQQSQTDIPEKDKLNFSRIAMKYNVARSSISRLFTQYCYDPQLTKRFSPHRSPNSQNKSLAQLTKRRITFIQNLIRKNCALSQRQIAAQMNHHIDLKQKRKKLPQQTQQQYLKDPYHKINSKSICRLMKQGNFTRKKVTLIPKNRNSQRTLQQRYNFCKVVKGLLENQKNKLYYLDQCRFNLFTSRDYGWAPRGELATKVRHNSKGKDIMLLAIIGKQGVVGYETSDSYNRGSFTIAINKLINNFCPSVLPQGQRIYMILDNCPIHNKDNLKHLQQTLPLTILYLPPYTPMLNPIQMWFNQLKSTIRSAEIYKTRAQLKKALIENVDKFKNKSMDGYYRNIHKYIELGLNRKLYTSK